MKLTNDELLNKALDLMGENTVTPKWLVEHVEGINSVQKAAAVMKYGLKKKKISCYSCRNYTIYATRGNLLKTAPEHNGKTTLCHCIY